MPVDADPESMCESSIVNVFRIVHMFFTSMTIYHKQNSNVFDLFCNVMTL